MKSSKGVDVPIVLGGLLGVVLGVVLIVVFEVVILLDERKPEPVNTSESIGKCIHAEVTLHRASIADAADVCYASLVDEGERALAREYAGYDADYAAWIQ